MISIIDMNDKEKEVTEEIKEEVQEKAKEEANRIQSMSILR